MGKKEVKSKLIKIISNEAGIPTEFDCDVNLMQLGIQSINLMKIQVEIIKEFAVKLKFREFIQHNSVNKLTECLVKKLGIEDEKDE